MDVSPWARRAIRDRLRRGATTSPIGGYAAVALTSHCAASQSSHVVAWWASVDVAGGASQVAATAVSSCAPLQVWPHLRQVITTPKPPNPKPQQI